MLRSMLTRGLEVDELGKVYPGTVALSGVSLDFRPGEVHALVGRNGAGKSTLVKILSGAEHPSSGRICLDGEAVRFTSPADAQGRGVAIVYQEMSLVPGLSVAENVLLGRMPHRRRLGLGIIDWRAAQRQAARILAGLGVGIDPRLTVAELDVAQRQLVEIAKAMSLSPRVLLLDEPTSALAGSEARRLFRTLAELRSQGVIVVYITHRLHELREIADRVSVLRDGRRVASLTLDEATPATLARAMFGESTRPSGGGLPGAGPSAGARCIAEVVLEVRDLTAGARVRGVSFSLCRGEVVGLAGMLGSGRSELLRAIFGADPVDDGAVVVAGTEVARPSPAVMKRLGVGLAPEDRREQGLVGILGVGHNLSLASLERLARHGILDRRLEAERVERSIRDLEITVASPSQSVGTLSGGNQQKVVIGNWLNTEPRVLLLDEPTRGIDVQAKGQIFSFVRGLADRGIAVLLVATELEDLLAVTDRVLVMGDGRVRGELTTAGLGPVDLYSACMAGGMT